MRRWGILGSALPRVWTDIGRGNRGRRGPADPRLLLCLRKRPLRNGSTVKSPSGHGGPGCPNRCCDRRGCFWFCPWLWKALVCRLLGKEKLQAASPPPRHCGYPFPWRPHNLRMVDEGGEGEGPDGRRIPGAGSMRVFRFCGGKNWIIKKTGQNIPQQRKM